MYPYLPGWQPVNLVVLLEGVFRKYKRVDPFAGPFKVVLGKEWKRYLKMRFYKGINQLKTSLRDRLEQMPDCDRVVIHNHVPGYHIGVEE